MTRQIAVAAVLGLALSACGVGADEDYATLGQSLEQGAVATSQDPVPPSDRGPTQLAVVVDPSGISTVVVVGSAAPSAPGASNSSSQDPIPPKVQGPRNSNTFR